MGFPVNVSPFAGVSIPLDPTSGRTLIVGPTLGGFGYTTLASAVLDAQRGDTIFVQPGTYNENVVVSRDYITIIGGQVGRFGWPDIAPTTGVALTVTGQGFVAKNCRFFSNDSDVVVQRGNGAVYVSCVFDSGVGLVATEGLVRMQPSATVPQKTASECRFEDCLFRGASGVGVIFQSGESVNTVGTSDNLFVGCRWVSSLDGTAGRDMITQDNSTVNGLYSVKNLLVKDCVFADKNKANYIDFTTTNGGAAADQSGAIDGCYFSTDSITTTNVAVVGTGFTVVGCYDTVGVQDGSGLD